jgi:peptide/nickel transport system permease protein
MIQDGSGQLSSVWWVSLFPGLATVITVLAFNILGDALRDAVDPRQVDG